MNTRLQCSIQWNQWNLSQTWKWKQLPFFFLWLWSWVPWKFSWHRWIRANPALIDVARSYFPHLTASTLLGPFWTIFWGCLSLLLEFGGMYICTDFKRLLALTIALLWIYHVLVGAMNMIKTKQIICNSQGLQKKPHLFFVEIWNMRYAPQKELPHDILLMEGILHQLR